MKKLIALFSVIILAGASYAKEVTLLMDWFQRKSEWILASSLTMSIMTMEIIVKSGGPKSIQLHKWRLVS